METRMKDSVTVEDLRAIWERTSAKEYVNEHPCVLHLWALFDGAPALPDFTRGIGRI
jgi:hypothetical protein